MHIVGGGGSCYLRHYDAVRRHILDPAKHLRLFFARIIDVFKLRLLTNFVKSAISDD